MSSTLAHSSPTDDLTFVRRVVERTHLRIDPHAFHFVHWGAIVLVWYPLANWFAARGDVQGNAWTGIVSFVLGMVLSGVGEARLARRPRLEAGNTFIEDQVAWITLTSVAAGTVLSAAGPGFGFTEGRQVPVIWGLVYANMAVMIGVVYRREFLVSGLVIFLGAIAAMALPDQSGYILGPLMGLGMLIPGLRAELRVRRLRADGSGDGRRHETGEATGDERRDAAGDRTDEPVDRHVDDPADDRADDRADDSAAGEVGAAS